MPDSAPLAGAIYTGFCRAANRQRLMPDGSGITNTHLIQRRWQTLPNICLDDMISPAFGQANVRLTHPCGRLTVWMLKKLMMKFTFMPRRGHSCITKCAISPELWRLLALVNGTLMISILPVAVWTCYWLWRIGRDIVGKGGLVAAGFIALSFMIDVSLLYMLQSRLPAIGG